MCCCMMAPVTLIKCVMFTKNSLALLVLGHVRNRGKKREIKSSFWSVDNVYIGVTFNQLLDLIKVPVITKVKTPFDN